MTHLELCFFLDANCVNARQRVQALNELEQWRERGAITLIYSNTTHAEAAFGNPRREEKVSDFTWTELNESGENPEVHRAIEAILYPVGPKNQNEKNDVLAVYQAERLRWPLITLDGASKSQPGGILGRAAMLAKLGVEVLTPEQALSRVKARVENQVQNTGAKR